MSEVSTDELIERMRAEVELATEVTLPDMRRRRDELNAQIRELDANIDLKRRMVKATVIHTKNRKAKDDAHPIQSSPAASTPAPVAPYLGVEPEQHDASRVDLDRLLRDLDANDALPNVFNDALASAPPFTPSS